MSAAAFLISAIAALAAVVRITRIIEALKSFRQARAEVEALIDVIDRVNTMTDRLKIAMAESVQALAEMQQSQVRVAGAIVAAGQGRSPETAQEALIEEGRWQQVRATWNATKDKLETIIESMDGRRRRPYDKITRYRYEEIISKLEQDGMISPKCAAAARNMDRRFNQLRPRPSSTTDADVRDFDAWSKDCGD